MLKIYSLDWRLEAKIRAAAIGAKPNLYREAIELVCGGSPKICVLVERKSRQRVKSKRQQPKQVWISCLYSTSVQSCMKSMATICTSHKSLYRDFLPTRPTRLGEPPPVSLLLWSREVWWLVLYTQWPPVRLPTLFWTMTKPSSRVTDKFLKTNVELTKQTETTRKCELCAETYKETIFPALNECQKLILFRVE